MKSVFLIALLFTNVTYAFSLGELLGYANDASFDKYEQSFVQEAAKHGITGLRKARIYFGETFGKDDVAEGPPGSAVERPTVIVDEKYWNTLSDSSKELLIFHELGHALLHENHQPGIMEHILLKREYYEAHREELLNQFFKNAQP